MLFDAVLVSLGSPTVARTLDYPNDNEIYPARKTNCQTFMLLGAVLSPNVAYKRYRCLTICSCTVGRVQDPRISFTILCRLSYTYSNCQIVNVTTIFLATTFALILNRQHGFFLTILKLLCYKLYLNTCLHCSQQAANRKQCILK